MTTSAAVRGWTSRVTWPSRARPCSRTRSSTAPPRRSRRSPSPAAPSPTPSGAPGSVFRHGAVPDGVPHPRQEDERGAEMPRIARVVVIVVVLTLGAAAPAAAHLPPLPPPPQLPQLPLLPLPGGAAGNPGTPVQPYGANDGGGFRDILPPGTAGTYNALSLARFEASGQGVPHCCDQLAMYRDLVYATPGLQAAQIPDYFKDSTFGVKPGEAERVYSPRSDVTIVRDKRFGVPHVYGKTRDGAMFGLGYAGAEDRLFFMDVLRHAGRGELSSFAGGSN